MKNNNNVLASECCVGTTLIDILGNVFKVIIIGNDIKFFQNVQNKKITQCILTRYNKDV